MELLTPDTLAASDSEIYAQARAIAAECDNEDLVTQCRASTRVCTSPKTS
jgi:hypothetical protein